MGERVDLGAGCQAGETPNYIHVDILDLPDIEYKWDLNFGLPKRTWTKTEDGAYAKEDNYKVFGDNTVDEFRCHHSAEHLTHEGFMLLMNEMYDALKPDGFLHLYTPNGAHLRAAHSDPTHRLVFTQWTMDYFCQDALNAFPYTDRVWKIDDGYPHINGTAPDDLWELEWILRPVK